MDFYRNLRGGLGHFKHVSQCGHVGDGSATVKKARGEEAEREAKEDACLAELSGGRMEGDVVWLLLLSRRKRKRKVL